MTLFPEWQAFDIAQDLIDRTGRGYFEDRFDIYAECFLIPHEFETFDGLRRIAHIDELRTLYDRMRNFHVMNGITGLHRRVVAARFVDEDLIQSTHESRHITAGSQLGTPYVAMSNLQRIDGAWKIARGLYATPNTPGHRQVFAVGTPVERKS
ncbi:hypothetical protein [Tropicibacter sp. S64]|uniref:hypothetical protein n=1 Tax=Tropicibacter sp. S64 TaxID=3415122 RepID=UPI003C7CE07C